jgi:hypothetical protein
MNISVCTPEPYAKRRPDFKTFQAICALDAWDAALKRTVKEEAYFNVPMIRNSPC